MADAKQERGLSTYEGRDDVVRLGSRIHVEHWRGGRKLWGWDGGDLVGTQGRNYLNARMGVSGGTPVRHSQIGTGTITPNGTQTRLAAGTIHGTVSYSKDAAVGSASLDRSFSISATMAITESGLFTGSGLTNPGTLYSRGTFPVRNVNNGDTITLNYTAGFLAG